jgi:D-alanine transaminase
MIDEKIVPAGQVDPAYLDRGIFFGDGVYEVVRSYNGKIFALDEHLRRFAASLAAVGIARVDIDIVRKRVLQAFSDAQIPNAKIYFHVTRGSQPRNHLPDDNVPPNFFLTVSELDDDAEVKRKGIAVSTHPDWRWKRCDIKSLNLLPNVLARMDAAKKGCDEAILVDENGLITEGAGSAFFAIFGRALRTSPLTANILPSITREFVIQAARNIGIPVQAESFTPAEAAKADELFIAVTTKDIVPVVRFDDSSIGDGKPGNSTKRLAEEFRSFT